jgi:ribosomal protein L37E
MENVSSRSATDALLTHEGWVELYHPDFYKAVKAVVSQYGNIPDQRTSLVDFEKNHNVSVAEDKKLSQWHYWRSLREELEVLESSNFRGDVYDMGVFEEMCGFMDDFNISYFGMLNIGGKIKCSECGENEYYPDENQCENCGFEDGARFLSSQGKKPESKASLPKIALSDEQKQYIKKWNDEHPENPIMLDIDPEVPAAVEPAEPLVKYKRHPISDLIGPFCATYPTIAYVVLKAGLHYPLAVAGNHLVLIREIKKLTPSIKPKATKSKPKGRVNPGAKKVTSVTDGSSNVPAMGGQYPYNMRPEYLQDEYATYACQWVKYSTNYDIISELLDGTVTVPKILINDAKRHPGRGFVEEGNVNLVKVLCKKDYSSYKMLMYNVIMDLNIQELITDIENDLETAIIYCNVNLVAKILSNPDEFEAAKKKNIMGALAKALASNKDKDKKMELITVINGYFPVQRFYTKLTKMEYDSDEEVVSDEDYDEEEVEVDEKHDMLLHVWQQDSLDVLLTMMRCRSMDIETFIQDGKKKYSFLLKIADCIDNLDDEDEDKEDMMKLCGSIMELYEYTPFDILIEAARTNSNSAVDYLINKYPYTTDEIQGAMFVCKTVTGVHNKFLNQLKVLRPELDTNAAPHVFKRKV